MGVFFMAFLNKGLQIYLIIKCLGAHINYLGFPRCAAFAMLRDNIYCICTIFNNLFKKLKYKTMWRSIANAAQRIRMRMKNPKT